MSEELEHFLNAEHESGFCDSTGHFTFDWQRTQRQLGNTLLPDREYLFLKLVQAFHQLDSCLSEGKQAPLSGAEIHFFVKGGILEFYGCWSQDSVSTAELQTALGLELFSLPEGALKDLCLALRVALCLPSGCGFAIRERGASSRILFQNFAHEAGLLQPGLCLWVKMVDFREDLEDWLRQRCRYSRLSLSWNTRALGADGPPQPARLGELLELAEEGPCFSVRPQDRACYSRLTDVDLWDPARIPVLYRASDSGHYVSEYQDYLCRSLAIIPLNLQGSSQLLIVRNGVTLDPLVLLEDFNCRVVLDGSQLPLDLSTFRARDGKELGRCQKKALRLILGIATELSGPLSHKLYKRAMGERHYGVALLLVLSGFVTGGIGWLVGGAALLHNASKKPSTYEPRVVYSKQVVGLEEVYARNKELIRTIRLVLSERSDTD